jgi:hypothetical protein
MMHPYFEISYQFASISVKTSSKEKEQKMANFIDISKSLRTQAD